MSSEITVRAFFEAAKVEGAQSPYDTIHLKIFYPGRILGSNQEKNMGTVPADPQQAPFPVVIFFNGFNCNAQSYQWLAVKLAEQGLVTVTFNWIAQDFPGATSLTPGVDIEAWKPEIYGHAPTSLALPTLLAKLQALQQVGILAGMLDLQRIILGGHSAGGRLAMENANPNFFPGVVASFGYGSHSMGAVRMGFEPGTVLPLPDSLPMLIMGGTCDGVIANSSHRYGITPPQSTTSVVRTFTEAISGGRKDSYVVIIEGANHFSIIHPFDPTTGRAFLDCPTTQLDNQIRDIMAEIILLFIRAHVLNQPEASAALKHLLDTDNPLIKSWQSK